MTRALVTGGSSGLGQAIARQLLEEGATVVSVDRTPDGGDRLIHITCDLSSRAEVDAALSAIVAAGRYDLAFMNAGANATGPFESMPAEVCRRLMVLNAETPMVISSALVREDAIRGHLCFVSSLSCFTGYPGAAVYAASKEAIAAYARSVRRPFAARGVSVTLACPGPLRTGHAARHAPPGADAGRRMPPEEAARRLIAATRAGRRLVIPGGAAKLSALAGRLAPRTTTRQMRRLIFERLDRSIR